MVVLLKAVQNLPESIGILERSQAGCVGRRHIHHEIIAPILQQPEAAQIVGGGSFQFSDFGLAQVDPDRNVGIFPGGRTKGGQPFSQRRSPLVVESHSVQDGAIGQQAKEPRLRVARLGMERHRAQLRKPKPQLLPSPGGYPIFVKTSRQAHGVLKLQAPKGLTQFRCLGSEPMAQVGEH